MNSKELVITQKENFGPPSIDIGLSLLWFYVSGIALLLASISNETNGDPRWKSIALYIAVTATAAFSALIGTATRNLEFSIIIGAIAGLMAGKICDNKSGTVAGISIGLVTSSIASKSGWEDSAITEYLVFLVAVCTVGFLLRELTALFLDREIWTKKLKAICQKYQ